MMKNILYKYKYEMLLSLLTIAMLAIMEGRHPYFFLQDDNRTYYLPYYVHNLKALLAGELPLFNFNQYLGTPVSFLAAPFYPVNYIALLLSKLFFGHYFGAMEFLAVFYLTLAAVGFYRFSRSFDLEELSCCFGSIAWVFSPFVITIGNSWIHTLGFAAYLPWLLLYSSRQIGEFSSKDFMLLLFFRLLAILLGYPQWFLYMAFFELILLVALHLRQCKLSPHGFSRVALRYFGNYLALLLVSFPFLLQLVRESSLSFARNKVLSWEEYTLYSYRIGDWLNGLLTPFRDNGNHLFGELNFVSHIGYVTVLLAIAALLMCKKSEFRRDILLFALLSLFSFLWSTDIIITKILYYLPFFNKLRYPFKLQFFTGFFLVTLATFGFNYFAVLLRGKCRGCALIMLFTIHIVNFLALYTLLPQRMLSNHLDKPPFTEPLKELMKDGRIVSAGPDVVLDGERAVPGNTVPTLGYSFAMLWNLQQFGGYEALLSERNFTAAMGLVNNSIFNVAPNTALNFTEDVPLEYLRKWGVRWYVINREIPLAGTGGLELVYSDRYRNVLHDPAGKPLVYWSEDLNSALPEFRFRSNSVEIATRNGSEGILTINVLFHPLFRGYLDGKEVPVAETEAGQISIVVPSGEHKVQLRYVDAAFQKGLLVSMTFLLSAAVLWGVIRYGKTSGKLLQ